MNTKFGKVWWRYRPSDMNSLLLYLKIPKKKLKKIKFGFILVVTSEISIIPELPTHRNVLDLSETRSYMYDSVWTKAAERLKKTRLA